MGRLNDSPALRKRDLATIHATKKKLGLDDATYRAMLSSLTGKCSAGEMDRGERWQVIQAMQASGGIRATGPYITDPDKTAMIKKIYAIIHARKLSEEYANAIARRMFGVDLFKWLRPAQMHKLVAALEVDGKRRAAR
ncbi:MAG: regulatory protein GemA [Nitrospinota bacterium]|nr:regulatory protein GemA [Nitrospinota bacterium]